MEKTESTDIINVIDKMKDKNKSPLTEYGKYGIPETEESKERRMALEVPDFFDCEEFFDINNTLHTSDNLLHIYDSECDRREKKMLSDLQQDYPDITLEDHTFYIPSLDLYIKNRCRWEHGPHPYGTKRYDEVLASVIKDVWPDAYEQWTETDVKEREEAQEKQQKWVEYYRSELCIVKQLIHIEVTRMKFEATDEELKKEYKSISTSDGNLSNMTALNKIVKFFQPQLSVHAIDKYFSDYKLKWQMFENRHFYCPIRWEDINNNVMIRGMSIAGKCDSYSMFNPKLIRWLINKEGLQGTVCYDPTGGWGHRMLGASSLLKKYIYNDLSIGTVEGVKNIAKYFNLTNVEFHNEDAMTYIPEEDYDFIFTCPPYYAENHDTEKYECDGFTDGEHYSNFLHSIYNLYREKSSCKLMAIIIREDMLTDEMREDVAEEYPLKLSASHFQRAGGKKRYTEYLYIFRKNES